MSNTYSIGRQKQLQMLPKNLQQEEAKSYEISFRTKSELFHKFVNYFILITKYPRFYIKIIRAIGN